MNINDVQVMVCGRAYTANWCGWKQSPDGFPRIDINATIAPHNMTPLSVLANSSKSPTIKDVIFNPPATIVFWSDNTKKLMDNNKFEYYNTFLHYLKKWERQQKKTTDDSEDWFNEILI